MDITLYTAIAALVTTVVNSVVLLYQILKKTKPEVKKLDSEGELGYADAEVRSIEGAKLSSTMLIDRVNELKEDLASEKKARRDDAEYFRRRIKDIEREARDYRLWAARLTKQVIEVGKIPVPFISSMNDSDPMIMAISKEQIELEKSKELRQAELNKERGQEK